MLSPPLILQTEWGYVDDGNNTRLNSTIVWPCFLLHWYRTERIRWNYALQYFLEFVFTIVVLVMCLKNFIRPSLEMIPNNPAKYAPPHTYILHIQGVCMSHIAFTRPHYPCTYMTSTAHCTVPSTVQALVYTLTFLCVGRGRGMGRGRPDGSDCVPQSYSLIIANDQSTTFLQVPSLYIQLCPPPSSFSPKFPFRYITISCLTNMVFGTFTLFMANSCILHQYMNFMAELTRFADRHFYDVRPMHTQYWLSVLDGTCVYMYACPSMCF